VQIQVIMTISCKNILQIWKDKIQCIIQHQKKGKKERKKNKNRGIIRFSSANSTNYANFLEIVFKWKNACIIEPKKQKGETFVFI